MKVRRGFKVIAEFSIHPIGEGTSLSRYVAAATEELQKHEGLRLTTNPMGTVIEADHLADILNAVEVAHERIFQLGAKRVDFTLRVDDRRDKIRIMEDKVHSLKSVRG